MQTAVLSQSQDVARVFLRRILTVDCTVSALAGIGLILSAEPCAKLMNSSSPVIMDGIGLVCLAFALFVGLTIRQTPIERNRAALIVLLNWVGVLLCAAVLLLDPFQVLFGGKLGILIFAVGMAILGIVEWYGLRRVQYP
jgi:hypothetical protein